MDDEIMKCGWLKICNVKEKEMINVSTKVFVLLLLLHNHISLAKSFFKLVG